MSINVTNQASGAVWKSALAWCKKQWQESEDSCHPSFTVTKILEKADDKFQLGSCGAEGICGQEWGDYRSGITYLEMGDTYNRTITAQTDGQKVFFRIESFGDAYERFERKMDRENGKR